MKSVSIKNLIVFFALCLPFAVFGAIVVHFFGVVTDSMPGGVFCVDDMCKGHRPEAYQLSLVRGLLVTYLSVLIWFWAGMLPARGLGLDGSVKQTFLILLSLAALVPLFLIIYSGGWPILVVVLVGIATVWLPGINRQILGSGSSRK